MQETNVLRELTNISHNLSLQKKKNSRQFSSSSQSSDESQYPISYEKVLKVNEDLINFGQCLPKSVHSKVLEIQILENIGQIIPLKLFIVNQDEELDNGDHLVFGINRDGDKQYFQDYQMQVSHKGKYVFKVGVKTPTINKKIVKSFIGIQLADSPPQVITLQQQIFIPQIFSPQELTTSEGRVIKLSIIEGKSKKQCRIPFRLNTNMALSMMTEVLGLKEQKTVLLNVKPKTMTLTGKGCFSLVLSMGINNQIIESISNGKKYRVRRILLLKEKDGKFIYHFPLQVTYFPRKSNSTTVQ